MERSKKPAEMNPKVMAVHLFFLVLFFVLVILAKQPLWLALFVVTLGLATRIGRIYCGHVCPMNTLMTPLDKAMKQKKAPRLDAPRWLSNRSIRWVFVALSAALAIVTTLTKGRTFPVMLIWIAVALLVTLRYKPEVFHNHICPFGTLQELAGAHAVRGHKVDAGKCEGHKQCEKVCPSAAIRYDAAKGSAGIAVNLCHQCGRCARVCPTQAIAPSKL